MLYIPNLHYILLICTCSSFFSFPSMPVFRNVYDPKISQNDFGINLYNSLNIRSFALHAASQYDRKSFPDESKTHIKLEKLSRERDSPKFIQILKSYASGVIPETYSPAILIPLIYDLINEFDATGFSDCLWSLSRLNINIRVKEQKDLIIALVHGLCSQDKLTSRQVTTSLGGMARLNMHWDDFPNEMKDDIIKGLGSVCSTLNAREIGNVFHSLQKIEIPWNSFPEKLQKGLLATFVSHSEGLVSQQGAMSIYALGLFGLEPKAFSNEVQKTIFTVAVSVLQETDTNIHPSITQQTSNVIYGLAKIGLVIPKNVRDRIVESLRCILGYMKEQEVSNTIYSLGILGFEWDSLPVDLRQLIESTIEIRIPKMTTQGVSTTLYGMSLMKADWNSMSPTYISTVLSSCIAAFNRQTPANKGRLSSTGRGNTQGVANTMYSIAICGARWIELEPRVRSSLCLAVQQGLAYMTSQEVSNIIYALGLMKADYHSFDDSFLAALESNYQRIMPLMNQQEMSSAMHGFAKMSASWSKMHGDLKQALLASILRQSDGLTSISLACCVYSLGLMGASWERLPAKIKDTFRMSMEGKSLRDQTISNVVYGMSLLQVEWALLTPEFRTVLCETLAQSDAFKDDIPQHISNVIWGLSKMDAAWDEVPMTELIEACSRVAGVLGPQEVSNIVYGFAELDLSWSDLSNDTREMVSRFLLRNADKVAAQEMANLMYSLAKITFDFDVDLTGTAASTSTSARKKSTSNPSSLLLQIHTCLLESFRRLSPRDIQSENYDQLAIYFELLVTIPGGEALAKRVLGRVPSMSGPAATVPSRLHANMVNSILHFLLKISPEYNIYNEFCGLSGTFPIDAAVYLGDTLVAFVEIDGEFHYKQLAQKLRRKDKLKEHLYKVKYPDVPLFRIRSDQCSAIGFERAGQSLASWIGALQSGKIQK